MVRGLLVLALLAVLAGCGGDRRAAGPPARTPAPEPEHAAGRPAAALSHAPVLVSFIQQRPGALIDKITVRTDGSGVFDRPSGGVGRVLRDVLIAPGAMRRLRRGLAGLPARPGKAKGRPAENGPTYILRYRGRTLVTRQGIEPPRVRGPVRLLAGLLVGDGIRKVARERLGGVAGSTHLPGVGRAKPRTVVFFQRQGAGGATLDTITVRTDGSATRQKRYGGAGGRFTQLRLRAGRLARMQRALRRLPRGSTLTRGSPPPGGAQYLLRYAGRTQTGRQGAIAVEARPAVRILDGFIDGIGVRKVKTDAATHRP